VVVRRNICLLMCCSDSPDQSFVLGQAAVDPRGWFQRRPLPTSSNPSPHPHKPDSLLPSPKLFLVPSTPANQHSALSSALTQAPQFATITTSLPASPPCCLLLTSYHLSLLAENTGCVPSTPLITALLLTSSCVFDPPPCIFFPSTQQDVPEKEVIAGELAAAETRLMATHRGPLLLRRWVEGWCGWW
jgi:hypothetical protein